MSDVVIKGNASGTGSVTIESPNTNSDYTVTLPAGSGELVSTGGAQTIEFAAGSASTPSITTTGDTNTGIFFPAADTIAFAEGGAEAMRIDSSGNVGIGTSNAAGYRLRVVGTSGSPQFRAGTDSGSYLEMNGFDSNPFYCVVAGSSVTAGVFGTQANIPTVFFTNNTEQARIDTSGNLLVGTTTTSGTSRIRAVSGAADFRFGQGVGPSAAYSAYLLIGSGVNGFSIEASGTGAVATLQFTNPNGQVGSVVISGSTTAYNTSSDYRLKHDIQPMTGALAKVAQLKPVTYKWNADDSESQGFIAHELQEVVPECVSGEKDAVDAEGNPQYQGIDTSFLVATLTAAIQELSAKNDALEARIAALEQA
jgi:hypothetical protein